MRRALAVLSINTVLAAAELPVREVTLYKHGIAYFERSGNVPAGETVQLAFKASEMNDVLKSLTLHGGRVSGLRYDASDPLSHRLAGFPFHFDPERPNLASFLAQLRGARVTVQFGSETVSGVIVSARLVPAVESVGEREQLIVLTDSGELRTLDISAAQSLKLEEPALQAKLRDYLRIVAAGRVEERRNVYIDSIDGGSRTVSASYVAPAPVWKSSYRLIFGEGGEATLEGWAIVDNTSGEDWTKVQLALVSGRPVSFISHLYEPRYVNRASADLPEDRMQAPVVHEGALRDDASEFRRKAAAGVVGGMAGGMPMSAAPPPPARLAAPSSVAATAGTRELGELFEYRFATPVTVKSGESAMLPFLQQKIGGRKLLIYSSGDHPLNAAELTNSTGKTLDGGPITVFDSGAYAGEALMETTRNGDKRLISYGTDLGTRVSSRLDSGSKGIREIHARRGVLTTRSVVEETKTYSIRNVDQKPKVLVIEHPLREGFKLVNVKPSETTARVHRFEVKLAPGASEKFAVVEERELESTHVITNLNPNMLASFVQNKELSDAGRKQLESILARKRAIAELEAEQKRLESDTAALFKDQERLRENIRSLNQVNGQQQQVQRYAAALAAQEARLTSMRDRQAELASRKQTLEAELNAEIEKLSF